MRRPTITCTPDTLIDTWRAPKDPEAGTQQHGFVLNGRLVTPLFGGGVEAGQVDKEQPIRATGIIGQLRHWWRITCGESDSATLFKRETAIWGGIGREGPTASKVSVAVVSQQTPALIPKQRKQHPDYATFSVSNDMLPTGFTFTLTFRLSPALSDKQVIEIQTAIRWWASFGGVGARTRRGMGSVLMTSSDEDAWLLPVTAEEVESLGGVLCLKESSQQGQSMDAVQAWNDAVNRLKQFRQGVNVGRNPGRERNRPGRSRWPEPDILRRETGRIHHHTPMHAVTEFMPRAAFGLPIVFHFQAPRLRVEPDDSSLEPVGYDRLASPLILRPYWDGAHWRSAALLLPGWEKVLDGTVTSSSVRPTAVWPKSETEREAVAGRISPMQGKGTDPLSAFMAFFMEGAGS